MAGWRLAGAGVVGTQLEHWISAATAAGFDGTMQDVI